MGFLLGRKAKTLEADLATPQSSATNSCLVVIHPIDDHSRARKAMSAYATRAAAVPVAASGSDSQITRLRPLRLAA